MPCVESKTQSSNSYNSSVCGSVIRARSKLFMSSDLKLPFDVMRSWALYQKCWPQLACNSCPCFTQCALHGYTLLKVLCYVGLFFVTHSQVINFCFIAVMLSLVPYSRAYIFSCPSLSVLLLQRNKKWKKKNYLATGSLSFLSKVTMTFRVA